MAEIERLNGALYNPVTGGSENQRTPTIFKSASGAASYTIWTPAAGKKFRLLGLQLSMTADAAISGGGVVDTLTITDTGTGVFAIYKVFIPTTTVVTVPGATTIVNINYAGNGYLSGLAAATLTLTIGTALTSGQIVANAYGTEE